jgi:hypothetical protein
MPATRRKLLPAQAVHAGRSVEFVEVSLSKRYAIFGTVLTELYAPAVQLLAHLETKNSHVCRNLPPRISFP